MYKVIFYATLLGILGLSDSLRPPPFFPLEAPRFFENLRDFENFPIRRPSLSGPRYDGEMKYTKSPIEIHADFHFQPIIPGMLPPPFLPPNRNFCPRFPPTKLFTPSRGREEVVTPGQVKNFQDDLKEMEKENENSLNELTTNGFSLEETTEFPATSSYVNVGITGDDNKNYKYNYSI